MWSGMAGTFSSGSTVSPRPRTYYTQQSEVIQGRSSGGWPYICCMDYLHELSSYSTDAMAQPKRRSACQRSSAVPLPPPLLWSIRMHQEGGLIFVAWNICLSYHHPMVQIRSSFYRRQKEETGWENGPGRSRRGPRGWPGLPAEKTAQRNAHRHGAQETLGNGRSAHSWPRRPGPAGPTRAASRAAPRRWW